MSHICKRQRKAADICCLNLFCSQKALRIILYKTNFPHHKYDLQDLEIRLIEICVYITATITDPRLFVCLVSTDHK